MKKNVDVVPPRRQPPRLARWSRSTDATGRPLAAAPLLSLRKPGVGTQLALLASQPFRAYDARLHPSPPDPGRGRHGRGGVHRLPAVPVRRRPGRLPARPGRHARADPRSCAPTSGSTSPSSCSSGTSWHNAVQGEFGLSLRQGAQGVAPDRRALPGHARAGPGRGAAGAAGRHPDGRVRGAAPRHLPEPGVHDALAARRVAAHLPDRHPADPGVRRARSGWFPSFGRGETVQLGWWTTGLLTAKGWHHIVLPARHAGASSSSR